MVTNDEFYETKFDSHKLLGKTGRDTNIEEKYLEEEDRIYVNGFILLPVEIINQMDSSMHSLQELTNHFNEFKNLNSYVNEYDVYVENIQLDLKEGDRVKLCF